MPEFLHDPVPLHAGPAPAASEPDSGTPETPPPGTRTPDIRTPEIRTPEIRTLRLADRDATLARATGSADARVHGWLVNDVARALGPVDVTAGAADAPDREARHIPEGADRLCAAVSAMCDIAPRDTIEGMLAAQMVAAHAAALGCLRRAAAPDTGDRTRDADLRHAARLLHVFERQMRVRDDRRNPALPRGFTGPRAPDAPGCAPGARVSPADEAGRGAAR